jgi:hypothetical protein
MSERFFEQLRRGADDDLQAPDLGPLRAAAEREELAEAQARLTDGFGYRLSPSDPRAPLPRDVARALTEAGFTLHHCARHHPRYRLGGVCLLPVPAGHDTGGQGGIAVSWTTHDLLALDWDRGREHQGTQQTMNRALTGVLRALGYRVKPFGTGGAPLVTGHRAKDGKTGR